MSALSAAGSTPGAASAYAGAAPSAASMRAQLQRFQKVLNECVNCASARTTQGKADIEATELRISQLEQRIADQEQAGNKPAADAGSAPVPTSGSSSGGSSGNSNSNGNGKYGGVIDVFA